MNSNALHTRKHRSIGRGALVEREIVRHGAALELLKAKVQLPSFPYRNDSCALGPSDGGAR